MDFGKKSFNISSISSLVQNQACDIAGNGTRGNEVIYVWVAFAGMFIWHIVREMQFRNDMKQMLNRIMSRNYAEFEYYDKKWDKDLKEVEEMREEERESRVKERAQTPGQPAPATDGTVDAFLKAYEEDWRPNDINLEEVKKQMAEEA